MAVVIMDEESREKFLGSLNRVSGVLVAALNYIGKLCVRENGAREERDYIERVCNDGLLECGACRGVVVASQECAPPETGSALGHDLDVDMHDVLKRLLSVAWRGSIRFEALQWYYAEDNTWVVRLKNEDPARRHWCIVEADRLGKALMRAEFGLQKRGVA
jgi:hypothetical protein